ncbi:glutathione S-transferase, partial [Dioszegia hungarica]
LQHQPFKQMPYMVDDEAGIEVYESRSIIKYIAMRVKSTLHVMGDINQVVRYQTACDVELANFTIFAEQLTFECLYKEMFTGVPPDPTLVAFLSRMLDTRLTGYERLLSQQPYLAGQELTLADLFHVPNALAVLEVSLINADGKSPNVARWWAEISSRASWTEVAGILGRIPT